MSKVRKIKVPKLVDEKGQVIEKDYAEELRVQKEKQAEIEKENQEDFEIQLKEFKKDDSYIKEYTDNIKSLKENYVLVRLFKFKKKPKNSLSSGMLVPDPATGQWKYKEDLMDTVTTNYAKVIISGDEKYKKGEVVILPYNKIRGFYRNPELVQYLDMISKGGNAQPIPPRDKREFIPVFENVMGPYRFCRPWKLVENDDDKVTFLIPSLDIDAND